MTEKLETVSEVVARLNLTPHDEGGWFRETYCSEATIICSERAGGKRALLTVIYYLIDRTAPRGLLHRNLSDIVHFHQAGGLLRYTTVSSTGSLETHLVGPGHLPQLVVSGGVWKATELVEGDWALVGEAVSPGFDYRDRSLANLDTIRTSFPDHSETLMAFLP